MYQVHKTKIRKKNLRNVENNKIPLKKQKNKKQLKKLNKKLLNKQHWLRPLPPLARKDPENTQKSCRLVLCSTLLQLINLKKVPLWKHPMAVE